MTCVTLNGEAEGVKNAHWMVTVILDESLGHVGADLVREPRGRGVDTRPFFRPLSSQPACEHMSVAEECRKRNPNAYGIAPRGPDLPSGFNLAREKVAYVCRQLRSALGVRGVRRGGGDSPDGAC